MKHLFILSVAAMVLVQGCTEPPYSNASGHSDYTDYELERARRDAALRGQGTGPDISGDPVTVQPVVTSPVTVTTAGEGTTATTAAVDLNNPGLSDEQNFEAVSSRETIESDAQRRAAQAAAYQVIGAEALPQRSGSAGPNIVQYALQTTNQVGQPIYKRTFARQSQAQRNCAKYQSADAAQRAFLANGGPQKNYRGLDPDGDGFACYWDPAPYRKVANR